MYNTGSSLTLLNFFKYLHVLVHKQIIEELKNTFTCFVENDTTFKFG